MTPAAAASIAEAIAEAASHAAQDAVRAWAASVGLDADAILLPAFGSAAAARPPPLAPGLRWHFFLSHRQATGCRR